MRDEVPKLDILFSGAKSNVLQCEFNLDCSLLVTSGFENLTATVFDVILDYFGHR